MKKIKILLILLLFFCCGIILSGCLEKKKAVDENINISVTPAEQQDEINFEDLNIDLGVEGVEIQEINN